MEEWCFSEGEPKLLEDYIDILSTPLNYRLSYDILYELIKELNFGKVCLEINLARRHSELYGKCVMYTGKEGDCYTILLYKGYYTLGVLLHEYTHVVVNERRKEEDFNTSHGYYFKAWLLILVRTVALIKERCGF